MFDWNNYKSSDWLIFNIVMLVITLCVLVGLIVYLERVQ